MNNKTKWPQIGFENDFEYIFKFKNGKEKRKKIKFIRNPPRLSAAKGGPYGILYDRLFFEFKEEKEKVALLWHEFYHSLFGVWFFKWGENQKSNWKEEFAADRFSAVENSVKDCLAYLRIAKKIYEEGKAKYNPLKHPPVEERIERIELLLQK